MRVSRRTASSGTATAASAEDGMVMAENRRRTAVKVPFGRWEPVPTTTVRLRSCPSTRPVFPACRSPSPARRDPGRIRNGRRPRTRTASRSRPPDGRCTSPISAPTRSSATTWGRPARRSRSPSGWLSRPVRARAKSPSTGRRRTWRTSSPVRFPPSRQPRASHASAPAMATSMARAIAASFSPRSTTSLSVRSATTAQTHPAAIP